MTSLAERLAQDGTTPDRAIFFYRPTGDYGCLSNFSSHSINALYPFAVPGRRMETLNYLTGEHRFQAMKAKTTEEHLRVARAPSAFEAKTRGQSVDLRDGWGNNYGDICYLVMLEVVMTKARQNPDVMAALEQTGTLYIYEDSPTDDIWGVRFREDYRGKNLLGIAWMQARYLLLGK